MFTHLHTDVAYYCCLRKGISNRDLQKILLAIRICEWHVAKPQQMMTDAVRKHFVMMDKIKSDMRKTMTTDFGSCIILLRIFLVWFRL